VAAGNLDDWKTVAPEVPKLQAVTYGEPDWHRFIDGIIERLPRH
jgi:hypothetical protein